ncbi:MAG TPA: copper resistance protein CopC [Dehalococcoidia bacterium]|nr:copper resistance protein CopC [Dehalococcoidia bacterium]
MFRPYPLRSVPRGPLPAIAIATIVFLACVGAVAAHARYDHSTPAQGATVATSPAQVDIYTAQDMQKTAGADEITVERNDGANSNGQLVSTGQTTVEDANRRHFSVALQPNLPPGRYVVSFKNVSDEDGEADHGQFAFYVGNGPTAVQKALDAKLAITAQSDDTAHHGSSHTGLIVAIIIAALIALAIVAAGGLFWRRRRTSG